MISPSSLSASRRGGTTALIVVFLLIIAAIVYYTQIKVGENDTRAVQALQDAQRDPQDSLKQFFLQCTVSHRNSATACGVLLDFMSRDDQAWFKHNSPRLSEANVLLAPADPSQPPDPERQLSALRQLLPIVPQGPSPIIVRLQTKDDHAVAYVHDKGHAESMREIFMVEEGGLWKIRRFLGKRDDPAFLAPLVKDKQSRKEPLDEDEQQFAANPQGYARQKRAEYLRGVGLEK